MKNYFYITSYFTKTNFYSYRMQKEKVGELKDSEKKQEMMNTVQQIKRAQERDSQQIRKLTKLVEKLLSQQNGRF